MDNSRLDEVLDDWEQVLTEQPEMTPDEFLAGQFVTLSAADRERFVTEAKALRQMELRMGRVSNSQTHAKANQSVSVKKKFDVLAAHAQVCANSIRPQIALPERFRQAHCRRGFRI